jgi:HKD family nuclease
MLAFAIFSLSNFNLTSDGIRIINIYDRYLNKTAIFDFKKLYIFNLVKNKCTESITHEQNFIYKYMYHLHINTKLFHLRNGTIIKDILQ